MKDEYKFFLIKKILIHLQNKTLSAEEEKIINSLKQTFNPEKGIEELTDKELTAAVEKNRKELVEKIKISSPNEKIKRRKILTSRIIIASGIAAVGLLAIIMVNFLLRSPLTSVDQETISELPMIEKQFSTTKGIKRITLADGSMVVLNRGTTLAIRAGEFNSNSRELWLLEGEAFFNVKKAANWPFIVHTPNGIKTQVVGTSFNIRAYSELDNQVISVNTGRVQVFDSKENKIVIDPNYKVSVSSKDNTFSASKTVAQNIAAWQSGVIHLEDATINEVAFRLKQFFSIDLVYNNVINPNDKIVTSFDMDTPLDEVLMTISKLYHVKYKKNGNRVELIK